MTVREVIQLGNPALRETSSPVESIEKEAELLQDLKDTLTHAQEAYGLGRGIAAPQIGVLKRVVYVQTPERSLTLINPEVTWRSRETFKVWDSCFSLDVAFFVNIQRHRGVKVEYTDADGFEHTEEFRDGWAELLQHEIDHLDGVVCSDHLEDPRDIVMRGEWEKRYRTPGLGM